MSLVASSEDPHNDIQKLLEKYSNSPDSEPRLKLLLPRIISTFGGNKTINEIMKELENHQESADTLGKFFVQRAHPQVPIN